MDEALLKPVYYVEESWGARIDIKASFNSQI